MKSCKVIIGLGIAGLVLSAASSNAQLDVSSGTVEGSLLNQELTGVTPGFNVSANDGMISTWVVSDSSLDSKGLIFIYQVSNSGLDAIDQVELTGFSYSQVSSTAEFTSVTGITGGSTPNASGYFPGENTFGGTVTFENGDLPNGAGVSDYLVVYTDASTFGINYAQIQDSFSAAGDIYSDPEPPVAVPESSTIVAGALMLLPLGIGAFRAIRKDRTVNPG
jgi:hypothetical protein